MKSVIFLHDNIHIISWNQIERNQNERLFEILILLSTVTVEVASFLIDELNVKVAQEKTNYARLVIVT